MYFYECCCFGVIFLQNNCTREIDGETKRSLLKMEIFGAIFVIIAATVLHFLYELSSRAVWAALFAAVNESVWEHLKIFSLPYVFWGFVELACVRMPFKKFVTAKVFGLYFLLLAIPMFFYSYTGLLGRNIMEVDIASGFVFTVLAFWVSYSLTVKAQCIERYYKAALVMLAVYYLMAAYFSTVPPHIFLFIDPVTGGYGIPMR